MDICITGASKGLGKALCQECVKRGYRVWGIARDVDALRQLEESLPQDSFLWTKVDVREEEDILTWKREMHEIGFQPEAVILNASVQEDDMLSGGYDFSKGESAIAVNLSGALKCIEAVMQDMLVQRKGEIIAIASTVALRPSPRSAAYAGSKAGIAMAIRTLDLMYARRGVRFKNVYLGPVATDMWEGKKNMLVPSAEQAASAIVSFVKSSRSRLYYPFLSTLLLRLSLWLPDSVFAAVSTRAMK